MHYIPALLPHLFHAELSPQAPPLLPASLGEHNKGAGAAFEGGLNSANSYGIRRITCQKGGAPQLLKQLPVEHGCLCLTGNLTAPPGGGRGKGGIIHNHTVNHSDREKFKERHMGKNVYARPVLFQSSRTVILLFK